MQQFCIFIVLYSRCIFLKCKIFSNTQRTGGFSAQQRQTAENLLYRGYYMAARRNEFYLRVLQVSLTSERSERVRDTFSTRR